MTSIPGAQPAPTPRASGLDPFRGVWALLTNVKFALLLLGTACFAGFLGVVIPQMPGPMRGNPAARQAWMELQREDFGAFTSLMERLQLFEVFYSPWFNGLWILIILSVTVSTVSRFRPTARSVHRPPRSVPDRYFEVAHHRADYAHPGGAEAVEAALRKRRYAVERTAGGPEATYLFAQRYAWAAYGTFISHLALLIFLVGGLLTRFAGFDNTLALAEGSPGTAVFSNPGPGQLFIRMVDAHRGQDAKGNIVDFHSDIEVTRGDKTVTCTTTVNDPCHAFGYKVHQAAFFNDLARIQVKAPDGRVLYSDLIDFDNETAVVPTFKVVHRSGATLFDGVLPQLGTETGDTPGREDDVALSTLAFPAEPGSDVIVAYQVGWRVVGSQLRLSIAGPGLPDVREMAAGDTGAVGDYRLSFLGPQAIPAILVTDMPGARDGFATVQMAATGDGKPYLVVAGLDDDPVALLPGDAVRNADGYEYTFGGRVDASGLNIRRDPGDTFIWLAVAMAMVGLGITFYVPRRRLWVKVTPTRTYFAGIAEKSTRLGRELRVMGAELGSRDALRPEDAPEG
jgi:cytochrome c biogenesis protein